MEERIEELKKESKKLRIIIMCWINRSWKITNTID